MRGLQGILSQQSRTALLLVFLLVVLAVCSYIACNGVLSFEWSVFRIVYSWPAWMKPWFLGITYLGTFWALIILSSYYFWRVQPLRSFRVLASGLVALLITELVKQLIARPRPYVFFGNDKRDMYAGGFGFPSGHTALAFMVLALVWPHVDTKGKVIASVLALLVALSRLYLGVHLPLDLVGGACIGVAVVLATNMAKSRYKLLEISRTKA